MNLKALSIGIQSIDSDIVEFPITLEANDRTATFKIKAQFRITHSDVSIIRFGNELLLSTDVKISNFEYVKQKDYPSVLLHFTLNVFYIGNKVPTIHAEGAVFAEIYPRDFVEDNRYIFLQYRVAVSVPFAVYAYLSGELKKLHLDELL